MDNPFKLETYEEQQLRVSREVLAQESAHKVMDAARACINTTDFHNYKTEYAKAEKLLIQRIIEFKEPDPLRYAFEIANMTANLRALKMLLSEVYRDARTKADDHT